MLARTPSTSTRNLIGFGALIAAAAIFAPSGKAQQLAANADITADRSAYLAAQCDHLASDPPRHAGCYAEKSIEFSRAQTEAANAKAAAARKSAEEHRKAIAKSDAAIAKSDAKILEYRTEAQCLNTLSEAIIGKRVTPAEVRGARKTPTETTNVCEVVRRLQPRLGQLTKQ